MNEINSYLEQATRGLWGRKRQEVWQELEANLNLRIQDFLLEGKSPTEAARQALLEMGKPQEVSMGMQGVYTLPKVAVGLVFAMLVSSVGLVWLTQVKAQEVAVSISRIALAGNGAAESKHDPDLLFGLQPFIHAMKEAGVEVNAQGQFFEVKIASSPTLKFAKTDELSLFNLVDLAEREGLQVRLEGWTNGELHIGKVILKLWQLKDASLAREPMRIRAQALSNEGRLLIITDATINSSYPYLIYATMVERAIHQQYKRSFISTKGFGCKHFLEVKDTPGTVYTLAASRTTDIANPLDKRTYANSLFDVAVVDTTGRLEFRIPAQNLEFTTDPSRIKPQDATGAEPVMLMKVTGDFKNGNLVLQPVMPSKPTSQNVPGTCF